VGAVLHIDLIGAPARADRQALADEGQRLLDFSAAGSDPRDVAISPPR
jgi:hypothetical protein